MQHFHPARQEFKKNIIETKYVGRKKTLKKSGAVPPAILPTSQNLEETKTIPLFFWFFSVHDSVGISCHIS